MLFVSNHSAAPTLLSLKIWKNNVLSHHVEFYLQFVGSAVYNQLLLLYPICSAQRHLNR